ncbi:MAG: hypothetical protein GXO79_00560 [Chlorobi bacterium]|nr:hypothetical protein [Chlorobiota bacterium]
MQRFIVISIITIFLASCKVIQPNKMFQVPKGYEYSKFQPTVKEYIIQPFDKLSLQIFTNDGIQLINIESSMNNMQRNTAIEYLVEQDGMINVPVLGRIIIAGMTLKEAEKMLELKYSEFYKKPFIVIKILNRRVIVFSEGSEKGQVIPLTEENFTLIEALAQAGGISDFSKAYKIKLIRGNLTNNPDVFLFNLSSISDLEKVNLLLEEQMILFMLRRGLNMPQGLLVNYRLT